MDWLFKSRPKVARVCTYCSGLLGLGARRGCCSIYCAAWIENERLERIKKPPDELVELLRYP